MKWFFSKTKQEIVEKPKPAEHYLFVKGLSQLESATLDTKEFNFLKKDFHFVLQFQTIVITLKHWVHGGSFFRCQISTPSETLYQFTEAFNDNTKSFGPTIDFLIRRYGIQKMIDDSQREADQKVMAEKHRLLNLKNRYILAAKFDPQEEIL